ncbi:MAG: hypothetical protein KDD43_04325 [Bdellovibrionales bacterium]|nr:hypothetical protein [Bdellovibrionales bacterium]
MGKNTPETVNKNIGVYAKKLGQFQGHTLLDRVRINELFIPYGNYPKYSLSEDYHWE